MTSTIITQHLESIENAYLELLRDNEYLKEQLKAADEDNISLMDELAREKTIGENQRNQLEVLRNAQ